MNLVLSLALGIFLVVLADVLVFRFTRLSARDTAWMVALATMVIYVPIGVVLWPGMEVFAIHISLYLVTSLAFGMIVGYREERGERVGFHWIPAFIISFIVILILLDAALITVAEQGLGSRLAARFLPEAQRAETVTSFFPGTVSHNFHEKEALYNDYLRQIERQKVRGWKLRKGWVGPAIAGEPALFRVAVDTREDQPLRGARVTGRFLRPSDTRLDQDFYLEEVAPGIYEGRLTLPAPGRWNLVLEVYKGDERHELRARTAVQEAAPATS